MEMWDCSHDWSVAMDGYRLFRKGKNGRWGGGVALYMKEKLESMELCVGMDEELMKSL